MTPLSTGQSVYRPPSTEAQAEFEGYVSQDQALADAYANCPDGQPAAVRVPDDTGGVWYPACAATGVFYTSLSAAMEDAAELLLSEWLPTPWS